MEPVKDTNNRDEFNQTLQNELDQARRSLSEVSLMLEQSQADLSKLMQRNGAITVHLQQIHEQFENTPRGDIRMTYDAALDAQHRLLVMRGQLDKLQTDQAGLQKYISLIEKVQSEQSENNPSKNVKSGKNPASTFEILIGAQEAERQSLSRQMHDGPAQALSNFIVQADIAARYLDLDPVKAKEEITNLKTAAMGTFKKVRDFIFELRPMMLDDLGPIPTIERYVQSFKDQYGVDASVNINGNQKRLDSYLEVFLFRTIQELMGNAARHNIDSPTKISIKVQITLEDNLVKVFVTDNGKGFDPQTLSEMSGLGLKLIRERLDMLGGSFEIDSAIGQGSKVSFTLPAFAVSR
jgi:two-component system, NarL family, sensor histidine kinase DegS